MQAVQGRRRLERPSYFAQSDCYLRLRWASMAATSAFRFSTFDVTRQVFFASKLSFGVVNLKPIVDNRQCVLQ